MSLNQVVLVSGSGIAHPYYSVTPLPVKSKNMFVRITSYPPLDSVTVIPSERHRIHFHVLVESESDPADLVLELWHNAHDREQWQASPLALTTARPQFFASQPQEGISTAQRKRGWFTGFVERKYNESASFTIRFRLPGETGHRWVNNENGMKDGILVFSNPGTIKQKNELSEYIDGLDHRFTIESVRPETSETLLWSLSASASVAVGDESGYTNLKFGLPGRFVRWFSLVRLWSPWLAPRQGRSLPLADKDAIFYSFLRDDGMHVACLALSGIEDVLSVFRFEHGKIIVNSRNDREQTGTARVLVAVGANFETTMATVVYCARSIVARHNPIDPELQAKIQQAEERHSQKNSLSWMSDWLDGFAYCTWNGLGQNLTEEAIIGALESLRQRNISVTNLIIDDNWQSLDNEGHSQFERGWSNFEANPKAFPKGLKPLTAAIRLKYNVKHIAVWHALFGYWGGISPKGEIAANYNIRKIIKRTSVVGGSMTVVDASSIQKMYYDFYKFLHDSGIDGVKTDAQFFLDEINTAPARRSLTSEYLKTWTTAQLEHFGGNGISCMSQSPQILFPCQLASSLPPIPVRNSDDFFPNVEESHPWHIFCNSHNAVLAQYLKAYPDWDMFQTHHKWGAFHAAARCVSGGPIYITDTPGMHDVDLIHQMTGPTAVGQTVILRPSVVGRSVEAYIGFEDEKLHKITAYDGMSDTGSSFLAIFNLHDTAITDIIHFSDFMGTSEFQRYCVKSHQKRDQKPREALSIMRRDENEECIFSISLEGHSWNILTATPVHGPYDVSETLKKVEVSNLGLMDKMSGAAAIASTKISVLHPPEAHQAESQAVDFSRLDIDISVKALGVLGIMISVLADFDWKRRILVVLQGQGLPVEFAKVDDNCVLLLDIESAWKHMKLIDDGSNLVKVAIMIH